MGSQKSSLLVLLVPHFTSLTKSEVGLSSSSIYPHFRDDVMCFSM